MLTGFKRFFQVGNTDNRIFGLDLMRFVAIVMVLLGHGNMVMPKATAVKLQHFFLDGVGIFFVLSGFLIGGILLRQLEKGKDSWGDLLHFWKRRWLRTLPAYFVVLILLLIYTLVLLPEKFPVYWYRYFFFIQNFLTERPNFFAESWSLSVEEWFYLSVPLLIFVGIRLFKIPLKGLVPGIILLILAGGILHRYFAFEHVRTMMDYDSMAALKKAVSRHISYDVPARLDAIMYGVLGAYIMHYFPLVWNARTKWLLLCAGLVILVFSKSHAESYGYYDVVWSYALKSFAVLLTLPALSNWRVKKNVVVRSVTFISLISYSMYLLNLQVVFYAILKNTVYGNPTGKWERHSWWPVDYIAFWVLTIVLSFLLYRLVEMPFMKMRKSD